MNNFQNGRPDFGSVLLTADERLEQFERCAIGIAIEVWRLENRVRKLDDRMIVLSLDKIQNCLKQIGIEVHDYTGEPYYDGMNLEVLTYDMPEGEMPANRIVQKTIRPEIIKDGILYEPAQVIVGKAGVSSDSKEHS